MTILAVILFVLYRSNLFRDLLINTRKVTNRWIGILAILHISDMSANQGAYICGTNGIVLLRFITYL